MEVLKPSLKEAILAIHLPQLKKRCFPEDFKLHESLKNLLTSALILILGVVSLLNVNPTGAKLVYGVDGMTFETFPVGVTFILIGLASVYFIISGLKVLAYLKEKAVIGNQSQTVQDFKRLIYLQRLAIVIGLSLYAFSLGKINFLISTALFLYFTGLLLGRRDYIKFAALSVAGAIVVYLLFVYFFKLAL